MSRLRGNWRWIVWLVSATAIVFVGASVRRAGVAAQDGTDLRIRQMGAYRAQDLHAAAAISGSFVTDEVYPMVGGPADVSELTDLSAAVIVGMPVDNICVLTNSGRSASTIYTVQVEVVLKGLPANHKTVSVAVLGGRVGFADGTWAQITVPNFQRPAMNSRMAFFLRRAPGSLMEGRDQKVVKGELFVPTSGPLGIYNLAGFHVQPAGYYSSVLAKLVRQYKLTPDAFVGTMRAAIH